MELVIFMMLTISTMIKTKLNDMKVKIKIIIIHRGDTSTTDETC